ncbi:two component transcriptional regulator, LytTR family [Luteibacter sp. UNC138MFCol5.1]|uniref:LytR/AlgR family response regulator transcription factor n=1 Tax=Luteibacter sp. UNC138MFCol5.1 TaxID=1502774 RepID=UPI0008B6C0B1|nr:LytTR family DNA-binding domain-containing protein [Luteibacter sp. UNC138MFCol5.1]SEO77612.1 two component transcriptional regulator, LytTR family [Luteibacter sp. UNC138MFCol5.1]
MPKCIVAEDEKLLAAALQRELAQAWPDLEVAEVAEDGGAALEAIATHRPDVAFLDIRMPGLTGMEVAAAAADVSPATLVVFITAYDQYAVDAFERGAVDYLLKPVTQDRLAQTVTRLRGRLADAARHAGRTAQLARDLGPRFDTPPDEPLTWVTASAGRATRLILVEDVIYFRADNKYTLVATADGDALLTRPIRDLLRQLDPRIFRQIHRSTIVNLRQVASVERDDTGKGCLHLRGRPETLGVSQPFMTIFRAM